MLASIRIARISFEGGELAVVAMADHVTHDRERLDELREEVEIAVNRPVVLVGLADNQMLGRPEFMRRVDGIDYQRLVWRTMQIDL